MKTFVIGSNHEKSKFKMTQLENQKRLPKNIQVDIK